MLRETVDGRWTGYLPMVNDYGILLGSVTPLSLALAVPEERVGRLWSGT